MNSIIILGGGGHAKVLISVLKKLDVNILGYTDISDKGSILGIQRLGDDGYLSKIAGADVEIAIGIGFAKDSIRRNSAIRGRAGLKFFTAISPDAIVNEDVEVGEGSVVFDGAVINSGARIGRYCIVNTRSVAEHDCIIGNFTHIAPGSIVCGGAAIGRNVFIGAGATVIQYRKVADNCVIGAGAVVVEDCPVEGVYSGIPAIRTK